MNFRIKENLKENKLNYLQALAFALLLLLFCLVTCALQGISYNKFICQILNGMMNYFILSK